MTNNQANNYVLPTRLTSARRHHYFDQKRHSVLILLNKYEHIPIFVVYRERDVASVGPPLLKVSTSQERDIAYRLQKI